MKTSLLTILFIFPFTANGQQAYDSILSKLPIKDCCLVYERIVHFDNRFYKGEILDAATNAIKQDLNFKVNGVERDAIRNKLSTTIYYSIHSQAGIVKANYLCQNSVTIELSENTFKVLFFNFMYKVKIGSLVSVNNVINHAKNYPEFSARSSKKFLTDWDNFILARLDEISKKITSPLIDSRQQ